MVRPRYAAHSETLATLYGALEPLLIRFHTDRRHSIASLVDGRANLSTTTASSSMPSSPPNPAKPTTSYANTFPSMRAPDVH